MKHLFAMVPVWVLLACATSNPMPEDVSRFTEQRDRCDTLRGELSGEGVVDRDAIDAINHYCKGSDKALADLLKKYVGNKPVLDRLNQYEPTIEAR
ncbi:hypothetical protein [Ideonella sp. BN130291]|uniref:hypothetical protein n=1 Tax=Ideonella sp. BN130291 TaxID=3112940 RepID=UPI002E253CEE|nr:hypothetical protein [Ideonella sp. BN130291]